MSSRSRDEGDLRHFKHKKVLVTGAASGLGRIFCESLVKEGATVFAIDRDEAGLRQTRATCEDHREGNIFIHVVDLLDEPAVDKLPSLWPEIDFLILNAGVVYGGEFVKVPVSQHRLTYRVNVEACVQLTHLYLPILQKKPEAHLLFMASATGLCGVPYGATYASSKWAVVGFAESLRQEFRVQKVKNLKMTIVCPSTIDTGMFEGTRPPLLMPILAPEKVVKMALRAVKRNQVYVYAPLFVQFVPFLKGILPQRIFDWLSDRLGVSMALRSWVGRAG